MPCITYPDAAERAAAEEKRAAAASRIQPLLPFDAEASPSSSGPKWCAATSKENCRPEAYGSGQGGVALQHAPPRLGARQIKLRAASSLGQYRPASASIGQHRPLIGRYAPADRPYRPDQPCFPQPHVRTY